MNTTMLRRIQLSLLVVGVVITVMAGALVVAAYRNDAAIEAHKGTVMADVVSATSHRAVVYFQTPNGQIYSPRLGLLYPTELAQGQRISVEYDTDNPDLARPAGRDAALSILPAVSIVVVTWLIIVALMVAIAEASRRLLRRSNRDTEADDAPATADV